MELFLQLGHGMRGHVKELTEKWGSSTTILSPKDLTHEDMIKFASEVHSLNGEILIDPQFYIPRTAHKKLPKHSFWPNDFDTNIFFDGKGLTDMLKVLVNDYVIPTESKSLIVPTLYISDVDDDWFHFTDLIIDKIESISSIEKILTLCISHEILLSEEKTHELIERLEDYPVKGFYIIPIHPNDDYLVDNSVWLINLMDIVASMKLLGRKIIVGYCNQQELILSLAKVDAICSGSFMKTRMFPLSDFDENDDDGGIKRKSTWYYSPQTLSEYQIAFLDIAHRSGILDELKTPDIYDSGYADVLFQGAQPGTVKFSEREAYRHFLNCLRYQSLSTSKGTYTETKDFLRLLFETSQDISDFVKMNGVRAKNRDILNVIDSMLSAIDAFDNTWGLSFNANWNNVI